MEHSPICALYQFYIQNLQWEHKSKLNQMLIRTMPKLSKSKIQN